MTAPVSNKTVRGVTETPSSFSEVDASWRAKGTVKATKGAVHWLKLALTLYDVRGHVVDVVRGTLGTTTLSTNHSTSSCRLVEPR